MAKMKRQKLRERKNLSPNLTFFGHAAMFIPETEYFFMFGLFLPPELL